MTSQYLFVQGTTKGSVTIVICPDKIPNYRYENLKKTLNGLVLTEQDKSRPKIRMAIAWIFH
jgi:hypothetical protein